MYANLDERSRKRLGWAMRIGAILIILFALSMAFLARPFGDFVRVKTKTPAPTLKSSGVEPTIVTASPTPEPQMSYLIPTVSPLLPTPTPEAEPNNPNEYTLTFLEDMLRRGYRKFDIYILSGDDLLAVDDYIQGNAAEFPDADIVVSVTCNWPMTGSWTEEGRYVIRYQFKAVCRKLQTN